MSLASHPFNTDSEANHNGLSDAADRLVAELTWLPAVNESQAKSLLSELDTNPSQVCEHTELNPLAHCNLLVDALLLIANAGSPNELAKCIGALDRAQHACDASDIMENLNKPRTQQGIAPITKASAIDQWLQQQPNEYFDRIIKVLDGMPAETIVLVMNFLTDEITQKSSYGNLLPKLFAYYAAQCQEFFRLESKSLKVLIKRVSDIAGNYSNIDFLGQQVDCLTEVANNWCRVARPIVAFANQHRASHEPSEKICNALRNLATRLDKECNLVGSASLILECCDAIRHSERQ